MKCAAACTSPLELETKVREDFTIITEKAPTYKPVEAFSKIIKL